MQEQFKAMLALQSAAESDGIVVIPPDALVVDKGVQYKALHSDKNGVVLRRMDDTDATVSFTQAEIAKKLNRPGDPMSVKVKHFTPANAKARLSGTDQLLCLGLKEQDTILKKEFFVRFYFKEKYLYDETCRQARRDGVRLPDVVVSTSPEPLKRVIRRAAEAWRELESTRSATRPTYRNKGKQAAFEEPGVSTVKGWISEMKHNGFNPICLRNNYPKQREEHFSADELVHLNAALTESCSTTKPKIASLHRTMEEAIKKENTIRSPEDQLRIPSVDTLRRRYDDVPPMYKELGKDGKDAADRNWRPEMGGLDVIRPFERVEFDDHETNLQAILVKTKVWQTLSKEERERIKKQRLWISAMIDVASRSMAAIHVSHMPPSIRSAMTTLELATRDKTPIAKRLGCSTAWPQGGLMEVLAVDSAVYFAHRPFRVAVNDMGVDLFLPPAGKASMRGFIERWFRTFGDQMFEYFTGRTWGSVAEKGDYDSEANASAIADQVADCIIRYVVDGYHNTPHSQLNGATPLHRWLELSRDHGVMPGPTGAMRGHLFGTMMKRRITKKGIRAAGLYFQSKEIQQIKRRIGSEPVVCRVNNHDLGMISVWFEQGWIEVPCIHEELAGVSIWQWLAATERLKLYHKENAAVSRPIMLATFKWLKDQADIARLENGLLSPILATEDYDRFEKKMDLVFDVVNLPIAGETPPEGEWTPSIDFFAAIGVSPVVYAKAKKAERAAAKAARDQAEAGGRPTSERDAPPVRMLTVRQQAEQVLDEPVVESLIGDDAD